MLVIDCNKLRVALFKTFYDEGLFTLYKKEDACEALVQMLGIIHASIVNENFTKDLDINILKQQRDLECNPQCFIHDCF